MSCKSLICEVWGHIYTHMVTSTIMGITIECGTV